MKMKRWMPFLMIGVMLLVMVGVMAMFSFMLSEINPMAMMLAGSGTSSMWGIMLVPFLGLLVMVAVMFFGFRWMTGSKGLMSKMMGTQETSQFTGEQKELTTMTFRVTDVNCAHCKMKIENDVGNLPGVTSVNVDVEAKQAVVKLISPPTKTEIETLLTDIGYPPETQ